MKIGILTYHHVPNYGALLQAYALAQVVKAYGHEVEFIDYRPYRAIIYYLKESYLTPYFVSYVKRYRNIREGFLHKLQMSNKTYYTRAGLKEIPQQYELVICGSDEIWNIRSIRRFDPSYFLDFVNGNVQRVSYAASFGRTDTLGVYRQRVRELIEKFDYISVRDSNSLEVIRKECKIQPTKVLDPTFLADFSKIISVPNIEKYVLVYGKLTQKQESYVKAIAESMGLMIVSIGFPFKMTQNNFLTIGPEEWLGYFVRSSYIFTNFYHGAIFSIIFRKPFVFFSRIDKANKINDLLNDLDLKDRFITNEMMLNSTHNNLSFNIDYDKVYSKLDKHILASKAYLWEALNGKRSNA